MLERIKTDSLWIGRFLTIRLFRMAQPALRSTGWKGQKHHHDQRWPWPFPFPISISEEKKKITHTLSLETFCQALSWRLEWNPLCYPSRVGGITLFSVSWPSWTAIHNILTWFSHYLSEVSTFAGILCLNQSQLVWLPHSAFVSIIKITNGPTHLTLKSEEEQGRKLDKRHEIFHFQSGVLLAFVLLVHLNPHALGLWLHPVGKFRFMLT